MFVYFWLGFLLVALFLKIQESSKIRVSGLVLNILEVVGALSHILIWQQLSGSEEQSLLLKGHGFSNLPQSPPLPIVSLPTDSCIGCLAPAGMCESLSPLPRLHGPEALPALALKGWISPVAG